MKPETKFRQNIVIPFLKKLKNTAFFPIQQTALCGDPDFLLCINGQFVALELKDEGQKPRPLQQYKLNNVARAKGIAITADRLNWPVVSAFLLKLSREPL